MLHNLLQLGVRQCHGTDAFVSRHIFGGDHGINDRFFGCIRGRHQQRINEVVAQRRDRRQTVLIATRRVGISCGEGQENIARAIAAQRARSRHPKRGAFGKALELVGQQGRIGGKDNDQGAVILFKGTFPTAPDAVFFEVLSDGNAGNRQLESSSEVGLRQRADGPAAQRFGELA